MNCSWTRALILAMEDEARWMIDNKLTEQTRLPDFLDYFSVDPLAKVDPKAVRLIIPKDERPIAPAPSGTGQVRLMKIRTRVKIRRGADRLASSWLMGRVVLHLDRTMTHLAQQVIETNEIVNKISILRSLTQDYLLYRTERAQRQWSAVYAERSQNT